MHMRLNFLSQINPVKMMLTALISSVLISYGYAATPVASLAKTPSSPEASALEPITLAFIEALSGPFANAGESVQRNLQFAIEQVNLKGGVKLPDGRHLLALKSFDSKQENDVALNHLQAAMAEKIGFVLQGNSSAVAAALIGGLNKHNQRYPDRRALFLNYSAVDPALTGAQCSFWHFRFDAHAGMRMNALTDVIKTDRSVKKIFLIGQDYSFGKQVLALAKDDLGRKRPDVQIVGDILHPVGKVKDFAPYVESIRASGADTLITGNWGNDLTLLVRALHDYKLKVNLYTFYGNSLGAPAAIGEAGVGVVRAVAEWHPNANTPNSNTRFNLFKQKYPDPKQDYFHLRMQIMIDMLVRAIEQAQTTDALAVAKILEGMSVDEGFYRAQMRASDHQLLQALIVMQMEKKDGKTIKNDVEGSGYGFSTQFALSAEQSALPTDCLMVRP